MPKVRTVKVPKKRGTVKRSIIKRAVKRAFSKRLAGDKR